GTTTAPLRPIRSPRRRPDRPVRGTGPHSFRECGPAAVPRPPDGCRMMASDDVDRLSPANPAPLRSGTMADTLRNRGDGTGPEDDGPTADDAAGPAGGAADGRSDESAGDADSDTDSDTEADTDSDDT